MHRPVRPPQGVDQREWAARVDAEARARIAVEEHRVWVLHERERDERRARRRASRRAWMAVVLLAVFAAFMQAAPGLTTTALVVFIWLALGKPGLAAVRQKFIEHRQ